MRSRILAAVILIVLAAAAWQQQRDTTPHSADTISTIATTADARAAHVRAEATRLRAHFDAVNAELRARDVSHLTPAQRTARARLAAWLREYRDGGEFPLNDGYADVAVPIFRDADGTLCAMAYLIARAGGDEIVERVARERNTAYIRELVDDPALVAWLDTNGLSAAEAARIQPAYGPIIVDDEERVSADYALVSMALAGASAVTSWINIAQPTHLSGMLGVAAGGASFFAGVSRLDDGGDSVHLGAANTAIGALTIAAAVHGLLKTRDGDEPEPVFGTRIGAARLRLDPGLVRVADRHAFGLKLNARF